MSFIMRVYDLSYIYLHFFVVEYSFEDILKHKKV